MSSVAERAAQALRAMQAAGVRRSFNDLVTNWQVELDLLLKDHDPLYRAIGTAFINSVTKVEYHPDEETISCRVQHGRGPEVTIEIGESPDDPELVLNGNCTCDFTDDYGLCEHTYAATAHLQRLFLQSPPPPLVTSILGEGESGWEIALRTLDQILDLPDEFTGMSDEPTAAKPKSRLVWRVTVITAPVFYGDRIRLEPVEQSPSGAKRGGGTRDVSFVGTRSRGVPTSRSSPPTTMSSVPRT